MQAVNIFNYVSNLGKLSAGQDIKSDAYFRVQLLEDTNVNSQLVKLYLWPYGHLDQQRLFIIEATANKDRLHEKLGHGTERTFLRHRIITYTKIGPEKKKPGCIAVDFSSYK